MLLLLGLLEARRDDCGDAGFLIFDELGVLSADCDDGCEYCRRDVAAESVTYAVDDTGG